MSNKYNEKQRDSDCRAPVFDLADAVSDLAKIRVFFMNSTRFSLFFERRRGWGKEVFVNEGERAGGREAARGLAAGVSFGLQYAEWQRIAWRLRTGIGVGGVGGLLQCYMLHV